MKKRFCGIILIVMTVAVLCACGKDGSASGGVASGSGTNSSGSLPSIGDLFSGSNDWDEMQKSFVLGGYEVSCKQKMNEWMSGTDLTNAIEALLQEKYGEEFVCEEYIFYMETALNIKFSAYPKNNPKLQFDLDVTGRDELEIWWDKYYNTLYRDEIKEYFYPVVEEYGIGRDEFYVLVNAMVTTSDITKETFYDKSMNFYLTVSEDRRAQLHDKMQDILVKLYGKLESDKYFFLYVCGEEQGKIDTIEDVDYKQEFNTYRGELRDGKLEIYYTRQIEDEVGWWTLEVSPEAASYGQEETLEASAGDWPALVMVDGQLYHDTDRISTEPRCGMCDGSIDSYINGEPTEDNQSNFGTGYGYQYSPTGIDVLIDGEWHIFEKYPVVYNETGDASGD